MKDTNSRADTNTLHAILSSFFLVCPGKRQSVNLKICIKTINELISNKILIALASGFFSYWLAKVNQGKHELEYAYARKDNCLVYL